MYKSHQTNLTKISNSKKIIKSYPTYNLYDNIGFLASYMSGFMSEYQNPSFYSYLLDGNSTYIGDGGNDMYDNGNFTTPWLLSNSRYVSLNNPWNADSYPFKISYSLTSGYITDTNFKYASLGYGTSPDKRPLTVIGTRNTIGDPIGWQKGGDTGADGGGSLDSGFIDYGSTINRFTVYSYRRQVFNATDPSICDLYILLGHEQWNSSFGDINSYSEPIITGGNGGYLYTSGKEVKNILAITTLLSKSGGVQVTTSECADVVNNMINRIKLFFNFN